MSWAAYRATLGWFHAKTHRLDAEVLWISNSKDSIITIQPKPRKDESKAFLAKFPALPPPKSFCNPEMRHHALLTTAVESC
jgi:hypothetical protein